MKFLCLLFLISCSSTQPNNFKQICLTIQMDYNNWKTPQQESLYKEYLVVSSLCKKHGRIGE